MIRKLIGHIVSGSLNEGLIMRVDPSYNMHELKTGRFVSIQMPYERFFSLITDLKLEVTSQDIVLFPPSENEKLIKQFLLSKDIYITATLRPLLSLQANNKPAPVKTIPAHFAAVYQVSKADVAYIFGDEQDTQRHYFNIGTPIDMDEAVVCLDLDRLTERSTGIFGKTGTGKTFLTRLLLAGLIHKDKAVALIFDMHSEYGLQARKESSPNELFAKGLKTLFGNKVAIFSLDPVSTRARGSNPDITITLSYQSISVEDVLSLQEELNLHSTACEAAYLIAAKYKRDWLSVLLQKGETLKEFAQEIGAHPESIAALYRKLKQIEKLPFFTHDNIDSRHDVFEKMLEYISRGISIVVEFGNYTSTLCYLLLANIITRRLHTLYIQKTEKFLGSQNKADEPKKLMIVIEEAHKFLNPTSARQTIFGTIAREMRKYYVSLMVIDQRPSGIESEILSQLGTKVIAQLNDERDIQAVLTGVSHANQLKSVLCSLESKKQVLLLGHAIAMPIVIQTRAYDEEFYKSLHPQAIPTSQFINELF